MKNVRLGVIGKPSDWLIASQVDDEKAKQLGIELVHISIDELIVLSKKQSEKPKNNAFPTGFDEKEIEKAYHIYLALKEIVSDHELDGLTVRCFDLLTTLRSTSCWAFALLNREGIIATCEGDVPSMIGMLFVKKILNQPTFQCNPSRLDLANRHMIFAHCTLPLNMCDSYAFDTHYESGIGIGIKGELKEGPITIFRIDRELRRFVLLEGAIVQNLKLENLCRTQIDVEIKQGIQYFLRSPLGNHHLIIYGHQANKIRESLKALGLEEVRTDEEE